MSRFSGNVLKESMLIDDWADVSNSTLVGSPEHLAFVGGDKDGAPS